MKSYIRAMILIGSVLLSLFLFNAIASLDNSNSDNMLTFYNFEVIVEADLPNGS